MNLTIRSTPRRVGPPQHPDFNDNRDSVEKFNAFPYLEQVKNIAHSESEPPPPALPQTETYTGTGALLRDYIAKS